MAFTWTHLTILSRMPAHCRCIHVVAKLQNNRISLTPFTPYTLFSTAAQPTRFPTLYNTVLQRLWKTWSFKFEVFGNFKKKYTCTVWVCRCWDGSSADLFIRNWVMKGLRGSCDEAYSFPQQEPWQQSKGLDKWAGTLQNFVPRNLQLQDLSEWE